MNQFMELALKEARKGMLQGKGGPFGAVVVKDNKVVGTASNQVLSNNDPTAHAEIVAIRIACGKLQTHDLSGCVIYATGEPCPMCMAAIIWANIKEIYYGAAASEAEGIGFRDVAIYGHLKGEKNVLRMEQIPTEAVSKLYLEYKDLNKTIY